MIIEGYIKRRGKHWKKFYIVTLQKEKSERGRGEKTHITSES